MLALTSQTWLDALQGDTPVWRHWLTVIVPETVRHRSPTKPLAVNLWQGTNPTARDFRVDAIGKTFTSTPLSPQRDGTYVARTPKPATGYTASFVELVYPSGTPHPFKFTTEVMVIPDVLPFQ